MTEFSRQDLHILATEESTTFSIGKGSAELASVTLKTKIPLRFRQFNYFWLDSDSAIFFLQHKHNSFKREIFSTEKASYLVLENSELEIIILNKKAEYKKFCLTFPDKASLKEKNSLEYREVFLLEELIKDKQKLLDFLNGKKISLKIDNRLFKLTRNRKTYSFESEEYYFSSRKYFPAIIFDSETAIALKSEALNLPCYCFNSEIIRRVVFDSLIITADKRYVILPAFAEADETLFCLERDELKELKSSSFIIVEPSKKDESIDNRINKMREINAIIARDSRFLKLAKLNELDKDFEKAFKTIIDFEKLSKNTDKFTNSLLYLMSLELDERRRFYEFDENLIGGRLSLIDDPWLFLMDASKFNFFMYYVDDGFLLHSEKGFQAFRNLELKKRLRSLKIISLEKIKRLREKILISFKTPKDYLHIILSKNLQIFKSSLSIEKALLKKTKSRRKI